MAIRLLSGVEINAYNCMWTLFILVTKAANSIWQLPLKIYDKVRSAVTAKAVA